MPEIETPSPETRDKLLALIQHKPAKRTDGLPFPTSAPAALVKRGTSAGTSPIQNYNGLIQYSEDLDTFIDGGTENVILADLDGSTLVADQVYLAVRGGAVSGIPIYWTKSPGEGSEGECESCGWLQDRDALLGISDGGMPPAMVQPYRVFRLTIPKHVGRCECISPTDNGAEPDADTDFFYLFYIPAPDGPDAWVGRRNFKTCCGCAKVVFDITPSGAADATLTLSVNKSCDAGAPEAYVYALKFQCCVDGKVTFSGIGPVAEGDPSKNCDGEPPYPCNNDFEVTLECVSVDSNCACRACWPKRTPHGFLIEAAGFTDDDNNGSWLLEPPFPADEDGCLFEGRCGIAPSLTFDDGGNKWVLSIGGFTYEFGPPTDFEPCLTTATFTRVGVSGDAPATLDVIPIIPEVLLDNQDDCCDPPDDLWATSAATGTTLHLVRSGDTWDTTDDDTCATEEPPGFSFFMELDPETCMFTPNGSASCCVIDPQTATRPTSMNPFLLTFTGSLQGPAGECEASDTITITDTAP